MTLQSVTLILRRPSGSWAGGPGALWPICAGMPGVLNRSIMVIIAFLETLKNGIGAYLLSA